MNRYRVVHVTEFRYDGLVSESYNEVRLRPLEDNSQSCLSFRLRTNPDTNPLSHLDHNGNWVHHFNILNEHRHLRIEADSVVLVQMPPRLPEISGSLESLASLAADLDEHYDLLAPTEYVPHDPVLFGLVAQAESNSNGAIVSYALASMMLVHNTFRYEKGATHVNSAIGDVVKSGAGVCQDFAHILLAMLRLRCIPARYVSGYLVPRRTAEPGANVEEVIGGQTSHAWIEAFIPGSGWFGLDPTLGDQVGLQHVRIAYGRDYGDVAPVRGVYNGHAGQRLSVDVRVRPALNDDGHEHLQETAAAPPPPPDEAPPQQQQQQQQQ